MSHNTPNKIPLWQLQWYALSLSYSGIVSLSQNISIMVPQQKSVFHASNLDLKWIYLKYVQAETFIFSVIDKVFHYQHVKYPGKQNCHL